MIHRQVIAGVDVIFLAAIEGHLVPIWADLLYLACSQVMQIRIFDQSSDWVPYSCVNGAARQENSVIRVAIMPLRNSTYPSEP
jgi:hypothetical protein